MRPVISEMGMATLVSLVDASVAVATLLRRPLEIAEIHVEIVVARDIIRLLGAFDFFEEFLDDDFLNHFAAGRVDRMCDVGEELRAAVGVERHAIV